MKNDYKITGIFEAIFIGFGLSFISIFISLSLEIKHFWFSNLFVIMLWFIVMLITMSIDENNYKI